MKILQINAVNAVASTGRNVTELNEFFVSRGHECAVAYSKGPSVDKSHEYVIGTNLDTKIHAFCSRLFGLQGYFSCLATRGLHKFINKFNPDIVVLNNLHGNFINLPMLLKYIAKKDIATVVVLHDCWYYTGKCCHYTAQGCYKWQDKCGKCPSLKKYNKSWLFDRTKKMLADKKRLFNSIPRLAVVGVSDWITNQAKMAPVFENASVIKRIYNWIDTDKFVPTNTDNLRKKLNLADKDIILCVASGWNKEKGIDTVLSVSEQLNDNEVILLVGNLPSDLCLSNKIVNIPTTHSVDQLVQFYSMADVFFQPSLEETFGKVSAEALSCGTPVVCFNSTANPELVGDGCGAVLSAGDIDGVIYEIRNIFATGKQSYSNSCRAFAKVNFSKNTNLEQYLELFKKITIKK